MRCVEFENRLHKMLDEHPGGAPCSGELPPALHVHAAKCENCSGLLTAYRQLFVGLAAVSQPAESEQFVSRIVAQATPNRRPTVFTRWVTLFATAASILIVLSLAVATRDHAATSVVRPTPVVMPSPIVSVEPATPVELVRPAAPVVVSPNRSRLELDQASFGMVLNLAGLSPVTFSAEVLEAHMGQRPAWLVEVADGLRPVTETMTGTLNALLRTWPGNDGSDEHKQGARYERYSRYDRLA